MARQRARAAASSAGDTSASSTKPPSRPDTVKRNGCGGDSAPPARTRTVTGAIDVAISNVSDRPGAPRAVPSACSTTTVATRMPSRETGSIRIKPGPSDPGTTMSVAGPRTTSFRKLGHAAGPGERVGQGVVDGDAGASAFLLRQRGGDDVEQPLQTRPGSRGDSARGVRLRGDAGSDALQGRGAGIETLPQFGLDPGKRRLVGRAEAGPFDAVANQPDDERDCEADAHDAHG